MDLQDLSFHSLKTTLLGGQAFNWDFINGNFYGFFKDQILKIENLGEKGIRITSYPESDSIDIYNYFDLSNDYIKIKSKLLIDEHITNALNHVKEVRILNQDFEQTLLSFILTSHKNIKAVRKLVRDLSKYFGNKIIVDGLDFYTFPSINTLANSSEIKLRELGAGFRARYLLDAAKSLSSGFDKNLNSQNEPSIREYLLTFNGVGEKIADCVMVFSLKQRFVTPLDIWGKRVLVDLYSVDSKLNYPQMRDWYKGYFGEYTAFAGQYLFEYYRDVYKLNFEGKTS